MGSSVTRFGEILPLWWNLKDIGHFLQGLFISWQILEPMLANVYAIGQKALY